MNAKPLQNYLLSEEGVAASLHESLLDMTRKVMRGLRRGETWKASGAGRMCTVSPRLGSPFGHDQDAIWSYLGGPVIAPTCRFNYPWVSVSIRGP